MIIHLVIGLPGSGKSTFAECKFDVDIVDDPLHIDEIMNRSDDFVIVDQSLCNINTFNMCLEQLYAQYPKATIQLYLFTNDVKQCIINAKLRSDKPVTNQIIRLGKFYDLSNYKHISHKICECYSEE